MVCRKASTSSDAFPCALRCRTRCAVFLYAHETHVAQCSSQTEVDAGTRIAMLNAGPEGGVGAKGGAALAQCGWVFRFPVADLFVFAATPQVVVLLFYISLSPLASQSEFISSANVDADVWFCRCTFVLETKSTYRWLCVCVCVWGG